MTEIWTQEVESERLHARFLTLKQQGMGQAEFARRYNIPGGPSMVSQHIKGRRPLDMVAATRYAVGFECLLEEISPRLAKMAAAASANRHTAADPEELQHVSPATLLLAKWLESISDARLKEATTQACMQIILEAIQLKPSLFTPAVGPSSKPTSGSI
jgi:hypothetical protein